MLFPEIVRLKSVSLISEDSATRLTDHSSIGFPFSFCLSTRVNLVIWNDTHRRPLKSSAFARIMKREVANFWFNSFSFSLSCMFLLWIPSQYCVCARANAEHHNATLKSCILKLMGKTRSWINFIHINKGNVADFQNDTFLLAQQTVRQKGISEFSRKVLAPKATKWMFGTACRNTGLRDPLTHELKTEVALMGNGAT